MEHTKPGRSKRPRVDTISFDIPINGRSYKVNATSFTVATGEIFYRVSYNNGPVHVFGWDNGLNRYADTDVQADPIPPVMEMSISEKLNEFAAQMQDAA